MAYTAGQALLQIVPSFKGVADAIDAEAAKWGESSGSIFGDAFAEAAREGTKDAIGSDDTDAAEKGASAGGKFADAFRARVEAALRALPEANVNLNDSEAEAKLAEIRAQLESLGNQRIGVDISDDEAVAKLAELKAQLDEIGASSESVRVKVDTSEASGELAGFQAEVAGADAGLSGLGGDAEGAGGGLGALGADAGESGGAIGALLPALGALAAALVPIGGLAAGALASIPAILGGAATGFGALKLGLGGISGALSAYSTQQANAGKTTAAAGKAASDAAQQQNQQAQQAISNAASIRSAANSVAQAEESLANARQSAANSTQQSNEQLAASEQALQDAEYNEQQAVEALTQARVDAQNQLQNYQDQLADGALGIQQAQLDIATAQDAVNNPAAGQTAAQSAQAQLTYQQAVQRLKDLQDQQGQLQQASDAASAAGVDGAQGVVTAQHQLLDATTAVATAQQANVDAAQAQAQAEVDGVQKVTDAQNALTTALQNQQDTLQQIALQSAAGGSGSSGGGGAAAPVNAFADAMAKLTPQGRDFVNFIISVKGAFDKLGQSVQAILLPGLQTGLADALLPNFKQLSFFIELAAFDIGQLAIKFGQFLGSAKGQKDINSILSQGAGFMKQLGDDAFTLFKAFLDVGSKSGPITKALGDGIQHIVDAFAKWAENGGFEKFLTWLKDNGPSIVSNISKIAKGFGDFVIDIEPLGKDILDIAGDIGQLISWAQPLIKFFSDWAESIFLLGLPQLIGLIESLATHWQQAWSDIKQWADDGFQHIKSAVFDPLVNFFTETIPHTFDTVVGSFAALPKRLSDAVGDIVGTVFGGLALIGFWLETNVWSPISNFFSGLGKRIASVAVGMWDGIANAFITAINFVINAWDSLKFTLPKISLGPLGSFGGETIGVPHIDDLSPISGKAAGGPVDGGTPYYVGEQGMELFVPNVSGSIVPNHVLTAANNLSPSTSSTGVPLMSVGEQHIHQDVDVQGIGQQLAFLSRGRRL